MHNFLPLEIELSFFMEICIHVFLTLISKKFFYGSLHFMSNPMFEPNLQIQYTDVINLQRKMTLLSQISISSFPCGLSTPPFLFIVRE